MSLMKMIKFAKNTQEFIYFSFFKIDSPEISLKQKYFYYLSI